MSGPPMRKDEVSALESLARREVKRDGVDESVLRSLTTRGLVQEKRTGVEVTARGKMNILRRNSTRAGKR